MRDVFLILFYGIHLHEQHALVYDEEFITTEPTKKMNDAYKAFNVQCPATINRRD